MLVVYFKSELFVCYWLGFSVRIGTSGKCTMNLLSFFHLYKKAVHHFGGWEQDRRKMARNKFVDVAIFIALPTLEMNYDFVCAALYKVLNVFMHMFLPPTKIFKNISCHFSFGEKWKKRRAKFSLPFNSHFHALAIWGGCGCWVVDDDFHAKNKFISLVKRFEW